MIKEIRELKNKQKEINNYKENITAQVDNKLEEYDIEILSITTHEDKIRISFVRIVKYGLILTRTVPIKPSSKLICNLKELFGEFIIDNSDVFFTIELKGDD